MQIAFKIIFKEKKGAKRRVKPDQAGNQLLGWPVK